MNYFMTANRATLLCAACLTTTAALANPTPASATLESPKSVKLEISQADLKGPGVQKLYQRIQGAARDVCIELDSADLARHHIYLGCVQDAVARAVADINSKELTNVHLSAHAGVRSPTL
jgi:UrcA family protein